MIFALDVRSLFVTLQSMINAVISLQLLSWSEQRPCAATRRQSLYGGHDPKTMLHLSSKCCGARRWGTQVDVGPQGLSKNKSPGGAVSCGDEGHWHATN